MTISRSVISMVFFFVVVVVLYLLLPLFHSEASCSLFFSFLSKFVYRYKGMGGGEGFRKESVQSLGERKKKKG